jgi:hypothetical protein
MNKNNILKYIGVLAILIFTILIINTNSTMAANLKGCVKSKKNGCLKDAVIYIEKVNGKKFQPPKENVILETKSHTFVPHVLPILAGTTVEFPFYDRIKLCQYAHLSFGNNDLSVNPEGAKKTQRFNIPGILPLFCKVHNEMSAFILVLETPFFAVTDENGNYDIQNIPKGNYKICVWHEEQFLKKKAIKKSQMVNISENKEKQLNFIIND